MSNLLSMDTRIVYINWSLLGTSQGLSHYHRRRHIKKQRVQRREVDERAVRITDQMLWNHYKRRRGRPKRTLNEVIH